MGPHLLVHGGTVCCSAALGFVFFGWFSLAVFGVTLQILGRVRELCAGYEDVLGLEQAE